MTELATMLRGSPYLAYAYSYPHKQAYRPLEPPVALRELWAAERRDALFLYLHVPFCEMRCGFCNLFTTVGAGAELPQRYLDALERQARVVRDALGTAGFARLAVGGGTPTFLTASELERLFAIVALFGVDPHTVPTSVETSPGTADAARLGVLRVHGVSRVSIGVQSFHEAEVRGIGRAQRTATVEHALDRIRAAGFPTLNIDLMYGLPGQTVASWLASLEAALRWQPEELFLYPLYVRPLTGLGRHADRVAADREWDALRLACYRAGRDLLRAAGYTQTSMRMFRAKLAPAADGPIYCCQEDGMVGLGCGARSYSSALHYSTEYAVGTSGVRAILQDYVARPAEAFAAATYGAKLSDDDRRRRYVIQSLLQTAGLERASYGERFDHDVCADLPQLYELPEHGLATIDADRIRLTDRGVERSDTVGPWLYAPEVRQLMEEFDLR